MPGSSAGGWEKAKQALRPSGRLVPQDCPADRCQETYSPKLIHQKGKKKLYDVGKNISGWVNIKVSGQKGQEVKIRFADDIDENHTLNYDSCGGERQIQQLTYILNSQDIQSYHPRFSWAAFRYFEIVTSAEVLDVRAVFVATDIEHTGKFECSNELFNRLYRLYIDTQRANIHGCVSSDCPHRERLGYTGDGQLVTEPILLNFDGYAFLRKWITDIKEGQDIEKGFVPHTIPFMGGGGGPSWGSAVIIVPWKYYLQTGDRGVLEEIFPSMERWMGYLTTRTQGDYIIHFEEKGGWCLGDWCAPGETVIPEKYVNTCLYAHLSLLMDGICRILGIKTGKYANLHENIKNAIITEWFNAADNTFSIGRQGANAMALWAKAVPDKKIEEVAKKMALHIAEDCCGHLDTGIIGTPILLEMLTEHGYVDIAYGIMNKRTYPSFGYMLENGATTLWERFEKRDSDNHPMFGTYTSWFIKALAGINADKAAPGYRKVIIKPVVPGGLEHVACKIKTMAGETIKSEWGKRGGEIVFKIRIPKESLLEFIVPDGYRLFFQETIDGETLIKIRQT
jgi:alpha-L-rhamnosidase